METDTQPMPNADRDDESGRYRETYPRDAFLEAIDAEGGMAGTQDVTDRVGCSYELAYKKLRALEDDGKVTSRKIGNARLWQRVEEPDDPTPSPEDERRDDAPADDLDGVPGTTDPTLEADDEFAQLVNDVADDALPGSGAKLEARREALHAVVEYLREHETATPADFRSDVYPAHNGQYTGGDDPARTWWKNAMSKGLKEIAERTDAVEKVSTTGEWSYQSDRDE